MFARLPQVLSNTINGFLQPAGSSSDQHALGLLDLILVAR